MTSVSDQHITWSTYCGDVVKVYASTESDSVGAVAVRWHWRRSLGQSSRIVARSAEPKKRRKDALWEARRVNPELTVQ